VSEENNKTLPSVNRVHPAATITTSEECVGGDHMATKATGTT